MFYFIYSAKYTTTVCFWGRDNCGQIDQTQEFLFKSKDLRT